MMTVERNERGPDGCAIRRWLFTVEVEPPSVLHLPGELDLAGAPTLVAALQPLTQRAGMSRLNLADIRFMDAARQLTSSASADASCCTMHRHRSSASWGSRESPGASSTSPGAELSSGNWLAEDDPGCRGTPRAGDAQVPRWREVRRPDRSFLLFGAKGPRLAVGRNAPSRPVEARR
jgi:hypothetical protein